jgi:hypothetical protein
LDHFSSVARTTVWVVSNTFADREAREAESVAAMQEWFAEPHPAEPHPAEPQQHPSVRDDE